MKGRGCFKVREKCGRGWKGRKGKGGRGRGVEVRGEGKIMFLDKGKVGRGWKRRKGKERGQEEGTLK